MIRYLSAAGLLVAAGLLAAPAAAAECTATVESTDAMKYTTSTLAVPASCKDFKVTLKHIGKLPEVAMGHNMVITAAADLNAVNADGRTAGPANEYVKPGDPRVIAASEVIGGGESTTFSIPVAKLKDGGDYVFFCSFPGHSALMKGTLQLAK